MTDPKKIIDESLDKGISPNTIKTSFKKMGFEKSKINSMIKSHPKGRPNHYIKIAIIMIIPIIVLFLIFLLTTKCDLDCFIERANNCESAKSFTMLEGNKISLSTKDCTLTKEITEFDENEPYELVSLLENKEMVCNYNKGEFTTELLTLAGKIELCKGDLKDALINIRVAQIELE